LAIFAPLRGIKFSGKGAKIAKEFSLPNLFSHLIHYKHLARFSAKLFPIRPMTTSAEKHKSVIEECAARLISRAANARGLQAADVFGRVAAGVEKYVLRDNAAAAGAEIREFVDALNADDLCLIIACERNDPAAWNDWVTKYDATVKSAARKVSANAEDAEDLASSIWAELHGLRHDREGRVKGKLSYYSGRGSLAGWLRAVISQLAVDEYRKQSKFVQIEETREFENLASESSENSDNQKIVAHGENPEEIFAERQTRRDVSEALKEAIRQLDAEDKLILKLYYFDNLNLKDIGAALGFHEATASRKVVRIQTEIRKSVEKILVGEKRWKAEEVKRYLSETASKLDLSVEKLFGILLICALVQDCFY
jgi:RNA polymerase sigma-70 factor